MDAFDIVLIILAFGIVGWIPIFFFFDGIVEIIKAFKSGNNTEIKKEKIIKNNNKEELNGNKKRWT